MGDARAIAGRHGNVINLAKEIKQGDIRDALPMVREAVFKEGLDQFVYDADGMGAPIIKLSIEDDLKVKGIQILPYRGGGEIDRPNEKNQKLDKFNKDAFENARAQDWYYFRELCENTYNAVEKGVYTNPSEMISFDSEHIDKTTMANLVAELSRPQRKYAGSGKIRVESKPEMKSRGVASPNLADSAIMVMREIKIKEPDTSYEPYNDVDAVSVW